jgi:hypothetical protein
MVDIYTWIGIVVVVFLSLAGLFACVITALKAWWPNSTLALRVYYLLVGSSAPATQTSAKR